MTCARSSLQPVLFNRPMRFRSPFLAREVQPLGQEPLPGASVTLAEVLKERGYATGAFAGEMTQ
jgi:hypothetical protein